MTKSQCIKFVQVSDDRRKLFLFPSAEGLAFIRNNPSKFKNYLTETETDIAGKNVSCFCFTVPANTNILHISWSTTIKKNEAVLYVYLDNEQRIYLTFPFVISV